MRAPVGRAAAAASTADLRGQESPSFGSSLVGPDKAVKLLIDIAANGPFLLISQFHWTFLCALLTLSESSTVTRALAEYIKGVILPLAL